jgi:hypothetical protein
MNNDGNVRFATRPHDVSTLAKQMPQHMHFPTCICVNGWTSRNPSDIARHQSRGHPANRTIFCLLANAFIHTAK